MVDFVVDDLEVLVLLSLFVVLMQTLTQCQPTFASKDQIMTKATVASGTTLDFYSLPFLISIATPYDYRLCCRLYYFNHKL